jgi:hypothetical protein
VSGKESVNVAPAKRRTHERAICNSCE